jgi:peroxiredoxin
VPELLRRTPLTRRRRRLFTAGLGAAIVLVIAVGAVAVVRSPTTPPRLVTIPPADRNASAALVRAAEAVGFRPSSGSSGVEDDPASAAPTPGSGLLPVGMAAPDFALRTPTGDRVGLRGLRGKAVLLEFFATWCPHCAGEAPHLRRLYASFSRSKVAFVSVNADSEDAPSVFAYHVYFGLPFPALLDPGGRTVTWPAHGPIGPISARYRVTRYPTFYLLDPRGRIVWRSNGEQPDALLRQQLGRASAG